MPFRTPHFLLLVAALALPAPAWARVLPGSALPVSSPFDSASPELSRDASGLSTHDAPPQSRAPRSLSLTLHPPAAGTTTNVSIMNVPRQRSEDQELLVTGSPDSPDGHSNFGRLSLRLMRVPPIEDRLSCTLVLGPADGSATPAIELPGRGTDDPAARQPSLTDFSVSRLPELIFTGVLLFIGAALGLRRLGSARDIPFRLR